MAKKHWIYIKRGLSEDPKHRAQMGECIWLYMHIIDRADWETGTAFDWKDELEAAEMSMPVTTLRHQRRKLEELEYIRCKQGQRSQDIIILEWINPRDYSGGVVNHRNQSDNPLTPSEFQGDNQGDNHATSGINTPSYDSKSKNTNPVANAPDSFETFMQFEQAKANHSGEAWKGREMFRDNHLPFADWWHSLTGQPLNGNKKHIGAMQKACADWQAQGLSLDSLKQSYDARVAWKKVIANPNEITADAAAIQALPVAKKTDETPAPYKVKEGNYVPNPNPINVADLIRKAEQSLFGGDPISAGSD